MMGEAHSLQKGRSFRPQELVLKEPKRGGLESGVSMLRGASRSVATAGLLNCCFVEFVNSIRVIVQPQALPKRLNVVRLGYQHSLPR